MYTKYEELRKSKGVRDTDVCRETGIPQCTFSDWKKGKSAPKIDKIIKICDYFGITVDEFVR